MRVFVFTCDHMLWTLRPFAYLFNIYWSSLQEVVVAGYAKPDFDLPPNFSFHSIAERSYPADRWSDGIIQFLEAVNDSHFVLMLEDYWLIRKVNNEAVSSLWDYAGCHPNVLRIDLTTDRMYSGHAKDVDTWGYLDIIETPHDAPYQFSTQACLVNRELMLKALRPSMSAWDLELQGSSLIQPEWRVLGTRQWPVRYVNGWGMGHKGANVTGIAPEHLAYIREHGYLEGKEEKDASPN